MAKTKQIAEFGDFQTPRNLAQQCCRLLADLGVAPRSFIEPTCGRGSFLFAAADQWPQSASGLGLEISSKYVDHARATLLERGDAARLQIEQADFFDGLWRKHLASLPEPVLIIGNPPWVTNAHLSALGSSNLPEKSNFQKRSGLEAVTGKANFDISEWMLIQLCEAFCGRRGVLAMLVKSAVARKALQHCWSNGIAIGRARLYPIDAMSHFEAAVDATLLVIEFCDAPSSDFAAEVFPVFSATARPEKVFGSVEGRLVADLPSYRAARHLEGEERLRWRSGIKHDCSKVMELRVKTGRLLNGLEETVDIESDYLYPMLKTSEVANGKIGGTGRRMIVTQSLVGQDTLPICSKAPKTWSYLERHREQLGARASSIYRGRPPFSIFGVGDYTFAPWKVAISGLYKKLEFALVGPVNGKPVVFDDATNFLSFESEEAAQLVLNLLRSSPAKKFYNGIVFWDAKRPLTVEILRRLDLLSLAREVGRESDFLRLVGPGQPRARSKRARQRKDSADQPALFGAA